MKNFICTLSSLFLISACEFSVINYDDSEFGGQASVIATGGSLSTSGGSTSIIDEFGGSNIIEEQEEGGSFSCEEYIKPINIWLAGDSTVYTGGTNCPHGWGRYLQDYFIDGTSVINLGASGRSIQSWLFTPENVFNENGECKLYTDDSNNLLVQSRWTNLISNIKQGDYLFIQFGINDAANTCPQHVGIELFQEYYYYMSNIARKQGALPIFLTPPSDLVCDGDIAIPNRTLYAEAVQQIGIDVQVPIIDLHTISVDYYNENHFCPTTNLIVNAGTTGPAGDFFCNDSTHFSSLGANIVAQIIISNLVSIEKNIVKYVK